MQPDTNNITKWHKMLYDSYPEHRAMTWYHLTRQLSTPHKGRKQTSDLGGLSGVIVILRVLQSL